MATTASSYLGGDGIDDFVQLPDGGRYRVCLPVLHLQPLLVKLDLVLREAERRLKFIKMLQVGAG